MDHEGSGRERVLLASRGVLLASRGVLLAGRDGWVV